MDEWTITRSHKVYMKYGVKKTDENLHIGLWKDLQNIMLSEKVSVYKDVNCMVFFI